MSEIAALVTRAKAAAEAAGLSVSTVSRKLFNDGKAIARLEAELRDLRLLVEQFE